MPDPPPLVEAAGFVLAGGRSSRMGTDKALIPLGGHPLIEHAVTKLRRLCSSVAILGATPELAAYAPLVPDRHPGCGPMSGIEAALLHSGSDWNLILPVDVPFLPTAFLYGWASDIVGRDGTRSAGQIRAEQIRAGQIRARVAMFTVDGIPQPTILLIHRELAPYLTAALARGEFKLFPVLNQAAADLARHTGSLPDGGIFNLPVDTTIPMIEASRQSFPGRPRWLSYTDAQLASQSLWFANLNTPQELADATRHLDALDTGLTR